MKDFIITFLSVTVYFLFISLLIYLLWGYTMVEIFNLPSVSYLQVFGLLVVIRLFFTDGLGNVEKK